MEQKNQISSVWNKHLQKGRNPFKPTLRSPWSSPHHWAYGRNCARHQWISSQYQPSPSGAMGGRWDGKTMGEWRDHNISEAERNWEKKLKQFDPHPFTQMFGEAHWNQRPKADDTENLQVKTASLWYKLAQIFPLASCSQAKKSTSGLGASLVGPRHMSAIPAQDLFTLRVNLCEDISHAVVRPRKVPGRHDTAVQASRWNPSKFQASSLKFTLHRIFDDICS